MTRPRTAARLDAVWLNRAVLLDRYRLSCGHIWMRELSAAQWDHVDPLKEVICRECDNTLLAAVIDLPDVATDSTRAFDL